MRRIVLLAALLAGCGSDPQEEVLAQAGYQGNIACTRAEGIERTTFCGLHLSAEEDARLQQSLGLRILERPEKHGQVTNMLELPFECRLLLFDQPKTTDLSGVFDSPGALFAGKSGVQFSSLMLARSPITGQACLRFVLDFG